MRVVFLMHGFFRRPFGGPRCVYEHANWLARWGHEVAVVHPLAPAAKFWGLPWQERVKSAAAALMDGAIPLRPPWFRLERGVRSLLTPSLRARHLPRADFLVATSWHTARWVYDAPPSRGRKLYYVHEHEGNRAPHEYVDPTYDLPIPAVARNAPTRRMLEDRGRTVLTLLPSGIDPETFACRVPPEDRDPFRVGMMYSRAKTKGGRIGFAALEILRREFPRLRATVFGIPPRPAELPAGVEYLENPPDRRLSEVYNGLAVFFSASWIEGWCVPAHEAMACGAAAVAVDTWGIHEYARHGENALIVPPRDPKATADAIAGLLRDRERRLRLARAGMETARRITWEYSTRLFEKALRDYPS